MPSGPSVPSDELKAPAVPLVSAGAIVPPPVTPPPDIGEDFSEEPKEPVAPLEPELVPYDPRPEEDKARRYIAYALIGILFLICYGGFLLVICMPERFPEAIRLLELLLGPVIALVSAATGFYYGTKK